MKHWRILCTDYARWCLRLLSALCCDLFKKISLPFLAQFMQATIRLFSTSHIWLRCHARCNCPNRFLFWQITLYSFIFEYSPWQCPVVTKTRLLVCSDCSSSIGSSPIGCTRPTGLKLAKVWTEACTMTSDTVICSDCSIGLHPLISSVLSPPRS